MLTLAREVLPHSSIRQMKIQLEVSDGQHCTGHVLPPVTIRKIKAKIQRDTGIPEEDQHLLLNGSRVSDDDAVLDDLVDGATFQLSMLHLTYTPCTELAVSSYTLGGTDMVCPGHDVMSGVRPCVVQIVSKCAKMRRSHESTLVSPHPHPL